MTHEVAKMLHEEITKMSKREGELFFFGSGEICNKMLDFFVQHKLPFPIGICDNSTEKQGDFIRNIPILSFEQVCDRYPESKILITSTRYGKEISLQVAKKIESSNILNIQVYFSTDDLLEVVYKTKYRDNSLPLPETSAIPPHFSDILMKFSEIQSQSANGENPMIFADTIFFKQQNSHGDFFVNIFHESYGDSTTKDTIKLQTLMNLKSLNKVTKIKQNSEHLVGLQLELQKRDFDSQIPENISQFNQYLKGKHIPFFYYQLPNKLSSLQKPLPETMINGQNLTVDLVLKELKAKEVTTLDFRKVMNNEGLDSLEYFYRTDAHWKQSLSLRAAEFLCERLGNSLDVTFENELFDKGNYDKRIYPNMFIGGYGNWTGLLYAGIDDFELFLPQYKTDYTWSLPRKNFSKRGNAQSTLVFTPSLAWRMPKGYTTYFSYGGMHIYDYTQIKNHLCKNSLKILILCDSFTMPMSTFLAPHFSEIHLVDIRGYLSKHDVFELIETIQPDTVVMTYWPHIPLNNHQATDINPYTD